MLRSKSLISFSKPNRSSPRNPVRNGISAKKGTSADLNERGNTITVLEKGEAERWEKATQPVVEAWLKQAKDKGLNGEKLLADAKVDVIGWSGTPDSGASFKVVKNAREAEKLAEEEQLRLRKEATTAAAAPKEVSVEQLFANIAAIRNAAEGVRGERV